MSGPVVYGLLMGLLISLLIVQGGPWGYPILWGLLLLQNLVGVVIVWRRTHLRYFTAGIALAALDSAIFLVLYSRELRFPFVPLGWDAVVLAFFLLCPLCLLLEARHSPRAWAQVKEFAKHKTAWDMLLFRHVPVLREGE